MDQPESYIPDNNNSLSDSEFKNLYTQKLATNPIEEIDLVSEIKFITELLEENLKDVMVHDTCILKVDSQVIQGMPQLINTCFVTLVKAAKEKRYRNAGIIFTTFCDYFNLDSSLVYKNLHEKLQTLIRITTEKMIGSTEYRKIEKRVKLEKIKSQGYTQKTFLDL